MRVCSIIICLICLLYFPDLSGQYYETGQDPSFIKWNQIKTAHFDVVYPSDYYGQATRYAVELENAFMKLKAVYPIGKLKIPVILHSYSIESNGYVSWAPKRVEIYPLPDQNSIPMDEVTQMSLHELDHVFEISSLNQGLTKGLSYIFGEQLTGALLVYVPTWFLEGDAVYAESSLSGSGRGSNPAFLNRVKALTLEDKGIFSYDKMLNGSFKDYTPDYYQFGYQMVSWSKKKYNTDLWPNAIKFAARNPISVNPVNLSLRSEANLTKKKLFMETFDSLRVQWQKEDKSRQTIDYVPINISMNKGYTSYYSPIQIAPDSIIAIKTSFSKPPQFVLINKAGKEKKFYTPGSLSPYLFSYGNGKIVWAEYKPDPRWENRGYSVIKLRDLKTGRTRTLTRQSRLMAPTISSDGKLIAAVESTTEYQNSLVILDASTGNMLRTVPAPGNVFLQKPQWSDDCNLVTIIYLSEEGEGIMKYNYLTGFWETLIPAKSDDLQSSFLRNDTLFWVSSSSGIDNIYIMTPEKKIEMVTSSRFGAYDLNLYNKSLLFSDYTSDGYKIISVSLDTPGVELTQQNSSLISEPPSALKSDSYEPLQSPTNEPIEATRYNKFSHLFRFHSWMPFYADIEAIKSDPLSVKPGVTIMSQNLLGTLITTLGYEYNNGNHLLHSIVKWKGLYPVIEARLDYGGEAEVLKATRPNAIPQSSHAGQNLTTDLSIPLSFNSGNFSQGIRPSFSVSYHNKYIYVPASRSFDYGQIRFTSRLYFTNISKSSIRDIFPRFGQVFDYSYSFTPFDNNIYGPSNSLKTAMYLPGAFGNQGLRLRFEEEIQKPTLYILFNRGSFPRGYGKIISERLKFFSADYAIPLFYPDFNVGSLLYLKRFRTNLFFDYAEGTGNSYIDLGITHSQKEYFRSVGFELYSDFYLLRIPFLISGGIQTSYMDVSKSFAFKMLFNIDIFGMQINRAKL